MVFTEETNFGTITWSEHNTGNCIADIAVADAAIADFGNEWDEEDNSASPTWTEIT